MKRIIFTFLLLLVTVVTFAVDRYLVAGGTGNWDSTTNWSDSDGGGSGASYPVAGDNVYFTTASANAPITVNVTSACAQVIASGTYAGQLTINADLTVAGTITFIAAMPNIAGTNPIVVTTTATLTSGGNSIAGGMTFGGTSQTYTLADDWDINGTLTWSGTTGSTFNGNTINAGGDFSISNNGILSGTTTLVFDGNSTISMASGARILGLNTNINTAGTITMNEFNFTGGTLTYIAGTVIPPISAGFRSCTLNTAGIIWDGVLQNSTSGGIVTWTLLSDLTATGNFTTITTNGATTINGVGLSLIVGGSVIANSLTTGNVLGSATIVMNGTGTISTNSATTGQIKNNITFNTAGTITFGTIVSYGGGGIMTKTAGTIVTTGSTLNVGNCTLNLADLQLNNFAINVADAVVTLSSGFKVAGLFSNNDVTGTHQSIVSSVGGTLRKITMLAGSTQSLTNLDATDIDSRDGYPVQSIGAVLSNTFNWYARALSSDFLIMFE